MSRMMPGRIRQEGIALYDAGVLQVEKCEEGRLFLTLAEEEFVYSLKDAAVACSCSLFTQKHYCQHLAAVEYFLKNDAEGKGYARLLSQEEEQQEVQEKRSSAGSLFLEKILPQSKSREGLGYSLSVEGQLFLFDQTIEWTLKISRLPDQRKYVIRDIAAFLRLVRQAGYYQIGKNYYEPISLEQFDSASQDVVEFLWKLLPEKPQFDSDIFSHMGRHLRLPRAFFEEGVALFQELSSFAYQYEGESHDRLMISPLSAQADLWRFRVEEQRKSIDLVVEQTASRDLFQGQYLLVKNQVYAVSPRQARLRDILSDLPEEAEGRRRIQFAPADKAKIAASLVELEELGAVQAPRGFDMREFQAFFDMAFTEKGDLSLSVTLDFEGVVVKTAEELEALDFVPRYQALEKLWSLVREAGFEGDFHALRPAFARQEIYPFFTQILPRFRSLGHLQLSDEVAALWLESKPQIRVEQRGSLLDISFQFEGIDQEEVDEALEALLAEAPYFTTKTGRVLLFDEDSQKISKSLAFLRARHQGQGQVQVPSQAATQLLDVLAGQEGLSFSEGVQKLAYDLAHPEAFPLPEMALRATLRDYQELGVRWLSMLDSYGFGGILADDMGLGKTLQTIAFLAGRVEKESKVLILTPSSLMYNWQEECQKFAPDLKVAVLHGPKAERIRLLEDSPQIVVTSYATFRQDIDHYRQKRYDYLILDEAQVMKNAQSKIAQHLREFEVGNCFALSGTPIENHLGEIWSIFQIVLPGLLPAKAAFGKLEAQEVARLIAPFVLRRKKEEVLEELPDLIEIRVSNELTDEQKVIYLAQLQQMQEEISRSSDAELSRRKIEILSGITRLRQICDTPALFLEDYTGGSGKLDALRELLLQLKEGNRRVLVFSQFRQMLDIIEEELAHLGLTSYKLTGSTPAQQRQEMTSAFNAGAKDVFLISLKAGGVGLNLTGADTVILVDLWWNPATEEQAISRAHRMGQTETVEFYRLITRGTIEEKIQALQESKRNLVTTVLDGNESRASMTVDEIRDILGIS